MKITGLHKNYQNHNDTACVFQDLSFEITQCGLYLLLQESGGGKTTLFRILSGEDKDYEGEVSIDGNLVMIDQEVRLMESMSVWQNLTMVSEDHSKITSLLEMMQMQEHRNKKVKHLSLGQKKRVQIIRGFLMQPSIYLCDEPTASLDEENAHIIMEFLKKRSEQACVIVATHDEVLCKPYADCVMKLYKDHMDTEELHQEKRNEIPIITKQSKPKRKQQILFACQRQLSRKKETFFTLMLLCFLFFTAYIGIVGTNIFQKTAQYEYIWKNGENHLRSQPKEEPIETDDNLQTLQYSFDQYDLYTYEDAKKLNEADPVIIGYYLGWDADVYSNTNSIENGLVELNESFYEQFFHRYDQNGLGGPEFPAFDFFGIYSKYDLSDDKRIFLYEMFDQKKLPLLYGNYMSDIKDVIISANLAEMLCKFYSCDTIDQLIGRDLTLYTQYIYEIDEEDEDIELYMKEDVEKKAFHSKIVGITAYQNLSQYQVFTQDQAYTSTMRKNYQYQRENMQYHHLDLIIDPAADDFDMTRTNANKLLNKEKNEFVFFQDSITWNEGFEPKIFHQQSVRLYQSIALALCAFLIGFYMVEKLFFRKREKKEALIMKSLGYCYAFVEQIQAWMLLGAVLPSVLLLYGILLMSDFGKQIGFQPLLILAVWGIMIIICSLLNALRVRKTR